MSSDVIGNFIFCPPELLSHCSCPTFHALPYLNILPYSTTPCFIKKKGAMHTTVTGEAKKQIFVKLSSLLQIHYLSTKNDNMKYLNYQNDDIILTVQLVYLKSKVKLSEIRFLLLQYNCFVCLQNRGDIRLSLSNTF